MKSNEIRILEEISLKLHNIKENIILGAKEEAESQISEALEDLEYLLFEVKGE